MPRALSELDGKRMGIGRTPQAEYPDGYLGTIRSRRDDRLLDSAKARVNQKSYQRGVHKGERVDRSDYYWLDEWNPETGLANQKRGLRTVFAEQLTPPPLLVNDGRASVPANEPGRIDLKRKQQLQRLMPSWS